MPETTANDELLALWTQAMEARARNHSYYTKQPEPPTPEVQRRVAGQLRAFVRDPESPPEQLGELLTSVHFQWLDRWSASSRTPIIRCALANPATPTDILLRHLARSPGTFCRNPVVAQIDLRSLPSIDDGVKGGMCAMLRCARAPEKLVGQIAQWEAEPELAALARLHVRFAGELDPADCDQALTAYWRATLAASDRPDPGEIFYELCESGILHGQMGSLFPHPPPVPGPEPKPGRGVVDEWLRNLKISSLTEATPEMLLLLAGTRDPGLRRMVMRHPDIPLAEAQERQQRRLFQQLLSSHDDAVRKLAPGVQRFARTLTLLHAPEAIRRPRIYEYVESLEWPNRVAAALAIGPRPNGQPPKRSHAAMLGRLSGDGNRIVRAVARRRIAEPGWRYPYL